MNRFGRWTQTVVARIDHMVTQVENHESLAESALRDVQQSYARARVRLERVRRDGKLLVRQLEEARGDAERWRERALATAEASESSALECLKRSKQSASRVGELELRLSEHRAAESQLAADVDRVGQRLRELREKRNLLRTRQSRAEAVSAAKAADPTSHGRLDGVFERWEERIATIELDDDLHCEDSVDSFELEFEERELEEDLRGELEQLLAERNRQAAEDAPAQGGDS
ncbi:MAG: PspA/IM30 family protein [Acidobacteriota bacterium]